MSYDDDATGDEHSLKKADILKGIVKSIEFIRWPLEIAKGYDISDLIAEAQTYDEAWEAFEKLRSPSHRSKPDAEILEKNQKKRRKWTPLEFDAVREAYCKWFRLTNDNIDRK